MVRAYEGCSSTLLLLLWFWLLPSHARYHKQEMVRTATRPIIIWSATGSPDAAWVIICWSINGGIWNAAFEGCMTGADDAICVVGGRAWTSLGVAARSTLRNCPPISVPLRSSAVVACSAVLKSMNAYLPPLPIRQSEMVPMQPKIWRRTSSVISGERLPMCTEQPSCCCCAAFSGAAGVGNIPAPGTTPAPGTAPCMAASTCGLVIPASSIVKADRLRAGGVCRCEP
mmetsp:Transcript_45280/g.124576  ORF Transcript_45280/g.124576 Transcript_45280/m.124576 type:complete len:228 (-) Transcript_45280:2-685(-)